MRFIALKKRKKATVYILLYFFRTFAPIFTSNSVVFVDWWNKNISCPRAQDTQLRSCPQPRIFMFPIPFLSWLRKQIFELINSFHENRAHPSTTHFAFFSTPENTPMQSPSSRSLPHQAATDEIAAYSLLSNLPASAQQ